MLLQIGQILHRPQPTTGPHAAVAAEKQDFHVKPFLPFLINQEEHPITMRMPGRSR